VAGRCLVIAGDPSGAALQSGKSQAEPCETPCLR